MFINAEGSPAKQTNFDAVKPKSTTESILDEEAAIRGKCLATTNKRACEDDPDCVVSTTVDGSYMCKISTEAEMRTWSRLGNTSSDAASASLEMGRINEACTKRCSDTCALDTNCEYVQWQALDGSGTKGQCSVKVDAPAAVAAARASEMSETCISDMSASNDLMSCYMRYTYDPDGTGTVFNNCTNIGTFSILMNIMSLFSAGGNIYGRKPFMIANMLVGCAGAIFTFFVCYSFKSFWGFMISQFLVSGVFGGSAALVNVYFSDIYSSQEDRNTWSTMAGVAMMLVTSVGFPIGSAFKSIGLFHGFFLVAGMQGLGLLILITMIPESRHPVPKVDLDLAKKKKDDDATPDPPDDPAAKDQKSAEPRKGYKKILAFIMIGALIDALGSEGFMFAGGVVMQTRFPCTISIYPTIMGALVAFIIAGYLLATPIMTYCGYGVSTVIGNVGAGVFQLLLANASTEGLFVALYFIGFAVSIQSNVTTIPMIMALAPEKEIGFWIGVNGAIGNVNSAGGGMILAFIFESFRGDTSVAPWVAAQNATSNIMYVCMSISFLATAFAFPTMVWFPPKKQPTKPVMAAKDYPPFEEGAVANLPVRVLFEINEERMKQNLPIAPMRFGDFSNDIGNLEQIKEMAHDDFIFLQKMLKGELKKLKSAHGVLTADQQHEEEREVAAWKALELKPDDEKDADRLDMAHWLADYLESAGYMWNAAPAFYKAVFMNAFPPVGRADLVPPGPDRLAAQRNSLVRFMEFMNMNIKIEKTNNNLASLAHQFR
eukprot:g3580.t1